MIRAALSSRLLGCGDRIEIYNDKNEDFTVRFYGGGTVYYIDRRSSLKKLSEMFAVAYKKSAPRPRK